MVRLGSLSVEHREVRRFRRPRFVHRTAWLSLFFCLIYLCSHAVAGQLYFPFGNSFGPNDSVEVFGTVGFVTDCPEGGIPDGWPYGVYPIGDIYVLRDGTIDGYSGAVLTDISGIPNTVVGGPSFVEIVAYTAPGGNLGAGDYDLVLDECQDGYYDPTVDFMLGMDDDIAFRVEIPPDTIIPEFQTHIIEAAKQAAANEAWQWAMARPVIVAGAVIFTFHTLVLTPSQQPVQIISTYRDAEQFGFVLGLPLMLHSLIGDHMMHWNGLAADPPDPDFQELAELGEIDVIYPVTDLSIEASLVVLTNNLSQQDAILLGLWTGLERFQGARNAGDSVSAFLQAKQVQKFASLLSTDLTAMNWALEAVITAFSTTGIDFVTYATEVQVLQDRLATSGLTAAEVFELRRLGFSDSEIAQTVQNFLDADFSAFESGDIPTTLDELRSVNLSAITGLDSLSLNAAAIQESLSTLIAVGAPVSDPNGPYFGVEGGSLAFDGTGSYDPDGDSIIYAWDLDQDGIFDDDSSATPAHTYLTELVSLVGLTVTDPSGVSNTNYTNLTVSSINESPVIDSVLPADFLVVVHLGDSLRFRIWSSDPESGSVTQTWAIGDSLVGEQSQYVLAPSSSDIGLMSLSVAVSDDNVLSHDVTRQWLVFVTVLNDPPVIQSEPTTIAIVGVEYTYEVFASDSDGDSLIYYLEVFPEGMAIDGMTGIVTWLPNIDQVGTQQVTLIVDDGRGGSVSQEFTASVYSQEPLFAPAVTIGVGDYPSSIVSADLDRDGNQDLAWTNSLTHSVAVAMGNGDCTFQPSVEYPTGTYYPKSILSSDLDADGCLDLVVIRGFPDVVSVLMNRGDGTFASPVDYPVGTRSQSVVTADFDGDGDSDLAVTNTYSHNVSILMNNGDGTFGPAVNYTAPDGVWAIFAADYDRDGDYDLAVTSRYGYPGVSTLMNNGDGTFGLPIAYDETPCPGAEIFSADFDSDGDYDLVVAYATGTDVFENQGDGTFGSATSYYVGEYPYSVFSADFDGDTDFDLAVTSSPGLSWFDLEYKLLIFTNDGDGTFNFHGSYALPNGSHVVSGADFDNDGDNDLVIAAAGGRSDKVLMLMNLSDPTSPTKGSLSGYVSYDSSGYPGVPIDLFDSAGYIVASALSDDSGWYQFEDLENGSYSVSILTPLGYWADEETKMVEVLGLQYEVNFELTKLDMPAVQRGRGYWMHQVNALLSGHGNAHETYDDMCNYMELIRTHFNQHDLNPVNVFEVVLTDDCDQRLEALRATISPRAKATMNEKARAHLTALLLNMVSGKIAQSQPISDDSLTVSQAITYCNSLITDGNPDNDEVAKDIAEMINEGQTVSAGMIGPSTADVAYKQSATEQLPTEFSLSQNYPNPFNPVTEILFSLPQASEVTLEVFNLLGQSVAKVYQGRLEAGTHSYTWDGSSAASGIYLYRLTAGNFVETKKMILLK